MLGLRRSIIKHWLMIKPHYRLHKQPQRRLDPKIHDAIKEDIMRLSSAKFIRPCR
jgi:ABC-type arginine transport system ATPase subunit